VFLGTKGTGWNYNGARIHDIWEIPRMGTDRIHSTEKPVELYRRCIEIATQPGALIFDGYVGSGSSAEAAYLTGRNFLGYEVDQEYWERATKRINSL
jgi:site-specific DNA-methyltransferase (adenine-specific)